ncbi:MAG: putative bifunctional diguanylate cyclase/phosphodiesterase [Fibrobacterota bacterium]|nr:EAL domain-containing protein [Chitinispirillaceae bacterium]
MINEHDIKTKIQSELDRIRSQTQRIAEKQFTSDEILKLHLNQLLFDNTSDGILVTDSLFTILKINASFTTITGYSPEDVVGKNASNLKSGKHEDAFYQELNETIAKSGKWSGEVWNRRKNGEMYLQYLSIFTITAENSQIAGYVGIYNSAIVLNDDCTQLHNNAYHDTLTGLPTRVLLNERLEHQLNHSKRKKQVMALLLLDLNRFKLINDTLGYAAGDLLLQIVTTRLKSCVREVDAIFRLGDDEFAIILEDIAQQQDAARVAKRVLSICSLPFQLTEQEIYITISIGISLFPSDGEDVETILKNAEAAMQRAKELGINNYQHYKPAMNVKAFEQLTLEHNLRKALRENEFVVYYQPLIDLTSGQVTGSEALVRWKHPELGMIQPGRFIPLAEETGLILPLGEHVLRNACEQTRTWQQKYCKALSVSVNLSARQFQQQDLVLLISKALEDSSLQPGLLELEITESLGMKNPELTLKTLNELKAMGIRISIDDFGTGYSSLSYLKKFPIDTIKIDRSFVSDIHHDSNDAAIVLAIIALAHSLGLKVIAEGVELKEQAEYLKLHGCEKVQGFLYSQPLPATEFEKKFLDI